MGHVIEDRQRKVDWDWFKRDKRLYQAWLNMRRRARRGGSKGYEGYAGVVVCKEWQDYWPFHVWAMENGYRDDLTLDRIDNNKGYSPDNCRWADWKQQQRNRGGIKPVTAFGETKLVIEWLEDERCVVGEKCLYARLSNDWHPEEAIKCPTGTKRSVNSRKTRVKAGI